MFPEIGSEFWIDKAPNKINNGLLPSWLSRFGDTALTSSGRGAISLLLQQINPKYKTALLPAYICDSVILPFIDQGFECFFYEVDERLSPKIDSIKSHQNIGVFLHMGYYGFPTNVNLFENLQDLKEKSTIIIEDITHTLFSNLKRYENNDFYIGSIRKWFGVPCGGFLSSPNNINLRPDLFNDSIINLRTEALVNKGKYIQNNSMNLKELFLKQFSNAEELLDKDTKAYRIDGLSVGIINSLNSERLISKRRENYNVLHGELKQIDYIEPLFKVIPENVCPIFYPVLIKNNRDQVRKKLINESIYCPVHWSVPNQIERGRFPTSERVYNNVLSIPCDQRYGVNDMARIVSVLKQ